MEAAGSATGEAAGTSGLARSSSSESIVSSTPSDPDADKPKAAGSRSFSRRSAPLAGGVSSGVARIHHDLNQRARQLATVVAACPPDTSRHPASLRGAVQASFDLASYAAAIDAAEAGGADVSARRVALYGHFPSLDPARAIAEAPPPVLSPASAGLTDVPTAAVMVARLPKLDGQPVALLRQTCLPTRGHPLRADR